MAGQGNGANVIWDDLSRATGTSQLPGDIIIQILVRLPIISVVRFKSVCKAWFVLFSSPAFTKHHARAHMTNHLSSVLIHIQDGWIQDHNFWHLLEKPCGGLVKKRINFSLEGNFNHIEVVGSINGLVCLSVTIDDGETRCQTSMANCLCDRWSIDDTTIVLWNPATRKQFQIPNPHLRIGKTVSVTMGFAYDQETDSYKVVRISYPEDLMKTTTRIARIEIYNTRTKTWKTTEMVDFPLLNVHGGAFSAAVANGLPYWYATKTSTSMHENILWFDASSESFNFHPFPHDCTGYLPIPCVGAMGEHPVVFNWKIRRNASRISTVDLVEIWKLTRFDDGGRVSFQEERLLVQPYLDFKSVIGIWRNGEIVALSHNDILYLCCQEGYKRLGRFDFNDVLKIDNYIESLVWPSGLV